MMVLAGDAKKRHREFLGRISKILKKFEKGGA